MNSPDFHIRRPWRALFALLVVVLLVQGLGSTLASTARAADDDEDDLFAELDAVAEKSEDADADEEEEEDDVDDYGFDDPSSIGYGIEELVVTGKASEGTAQAVPEAITEFSQSDLDKMNISNVEALSLNTPSLHVGKFGNQPVITLRGVGAANLTTVGTPGVGFEVDGIHQGRPSAAAVRIYDVEDVRVYKGPQGVDGGYQTNGGRIAVKSMRPQEDFDVMGDVQYGAYDQILLRGAVNVPVLPDGLLMTRATVTYENRDGYQENLIYDVRNFDADDANELITRFQSRSLFSDESIEFRTIGGYNFQKGIGPARHVLFQDLQSYQEFLSLQPGATELPFRVSRLIVPGCTNLDQYACLSDDPRKTYQSQVGFQDNTQSNVTGIFNWDMPYFQESEWVSDLRLSAVGGWVQTNRASLVDVDGTNNPYSIFEQDLTATQGSLEVFIERPDVERFDFKLGAFYLREQVDSYQCLDAQGYRSENTDVASDQDLLNQSIAGYGDVGYRLLDNLRVSGGVRYSSERKKVDQINYRYTNLESQTGGTAPNNTRCSKFFQAFVERDTTSFIKVDGGPSSTFTASGDDTWNKLTYAASAEWDVTDFNALAVSFASGFKPGGFTLGANPAAGEIDENFGPEEVLQYQLVSKNQLFDSKLQANVTLFWTDYDPFQVCQIIGVQYSCADDGEALSRGVELEMVYMPIEGLTFNGHFNYLDARVDNFFLRDPTDKLPGETQVSVNAGPTRDLSGNRLEKAPRFAGSLGVQYDWDLERWGILSPRVQTQSQSRTYYRTFNKEQFSQEAFVKLDLSLEWRSEDGIYVVRGFVDNVTDVDVLNFLFIGPAAIGAPTLGYYLPPRTWGIRVGITSLPDFF